MEIFKLAMTETDWDPYAFSSLCWVLKTSRPIRRLLQTNLIFIGQADEIYQRIKRCREIPACFFGLFVAVIITLQIEAEQLRKINSNLLTFFISYFSNRQDNIYLYQKRKIR